MTDKLLPLCRLCSSRPEMNERDECACSGDECALNVFWLSAEEWSKLHSEQPTRDAPLNITALVRKRLRGIVHWETDRKGDVYGELTWHDVGVLLNELEKEAAEEEKPHER